MMRHTVNVLLTFACTLCVMIPSILRAETSGASDKPNIIVILVDDLGWRDTGYAGNTFIETPNIDQLAHEGLVFDRAYSNSPNCAPSRAAIVSGQYAPRTDVYTMMTGDMGNKRLRRVLTPPNKMYLEPKVITLAEMLRSAGYRTAQIGKWNLGTGEVRGPLGQGFDVNIAGYRGGEAYGGFFAPYDYLPGLEHAPKGEYLTDRLTDEAIKFIRQPDQRPFFIYLSHFAPHFPFQAPEALVEKYNHKKKTTPADEATMPEYAGMVEAIDTGVGKIMATLREQHLDNNTLVIFTSDNGGSRYATSLRPLRGNKSQIYEGGLRVPMLVWWPGHVIPHATEEPVMGIDLFPTFMHVAHIDSVAQPLDGVDLSPLFTPNSSNVHTSLPRDALFWYFPAYVASTDVDAPDTLFTQRPVAAIQKNDWKLIRYFDSSNVELYHLADDASERHDLSKQEPEKVQALSAELQQWLAQMDRPTTLLPNPTFSAAYEQKLKNSWLHQLRIYLSDTRYGAFFREKDLEN